MTRITIGTRGSKLALWQAEWVKTELLRIHPDLQVKLKKIKTTGDKILDVPLAKVGGKGLFVKEIEEALLIGEADLAVHSMKDMPSEFPAGLHLAAICKREEPRDAFIAQIQNSRFKIPNFSAIPKGAIIGTSSLRRSCQLLNMRPDLNIVQLRGNLDTRLRKLDEGRFDAIILASAGLIRLGLTNRITEILSIEQSLPAVGQGAIGIETRINDKFMNNLISLLNHQETSICVKAERAFLKRLEGGCQVPIAAHARIIKQENIEIKTKNSNIHYSLIINGLVGSLSGDRIIRQSIEGSPEDYESLGIQLAEDLLSKGAERILNEVYSR